MRIEPAELAFDSEGTPYSPAYGDVYHSAESGPGQARHVFVGGSDLPRRWAHERNFTILETGFGLGLNFLATWREWRADPARCERLHFVSIEKHPFERDALRTLHRRYAEFAPLAERLRQAWPPLVAGLHRLHLDGERLTLTLAFGDVALLMPRLRLRADGVYLDGFAPRCNPEMWSPQLMRQLARLARPGTSVATYSSAGAVRQGLEAAGFTLEKCSGFGRKREMLRGSYAPRRPPRSPREAVPGRTSRHAIVIGAGLAGAAISERLASRGWQIDLIERRAPPGAQTPGSYAGVFHPHISRDDCILSRATRSGFLYAVSRWPALERTGQALAWARCGVLQLGGDSDREQRMTEAIAALGYPPDYAQYVERGAAETLARCRLKSGGWWFPGAGWMRPLGLIAAQLAAAGARATRAAALTPHFGIGVHAIERNGGEWRALAADGRLIAAAPVLVLANSNDTTRLASIAQPLKNIRGQITYLPAEILTAPRVVLTGSGYVLPAAGGIVVTGSTYDRDNDDPEPQVQSHEANLLRLAQLLPHAQLALDASKLGGAVGFRCVAPDRMPLIGAMPDVDAAHTQKAALSGAQLADLPRCPGLYCASAYASRGLIWATLAGELLASLIEGEPLPLEGDLADALDPGRFVLRQARHAKL
ncbi:MAG: bifunctional tRNA (5-methylaminomethyl-2-thiouridine)(34)-methyltransferase MnmD/FAD-dependent 5-carboxymethylaminomethyl-2-thiouridine(34) oxidoreductase MnmC [Betaproteobacteria bacterium]|nr:MAG: bifunctional tRNA (5-methylaminomethyl-2-thiouridine)(34)-methyltransferase MnmD/FAD-dependent 5-carboxymethylaminomethyl-2-thiouridine(34) oxidoreductase MnmC [Betaproteobacteria bacterium]